MNIWVFEFEIIARSTVHLPSVFSGGALRGGFGNILRELTCVTKMAECDQCPLLRECPFTQLFNPIAENDGHFHTGANLPRPFVLSGPDTEQLSHGQHARFRLTLVGKSIEYLPYVVLAFRQLGKVGLGKGRGKFELSAVYSIDPLSGKFPKQIFDTKENVLYSSKAYDLSLESIVDHVADSRVDKLKVHLLTPTHLVSSNSRLHEPPSFAHLIRAVLRRYSDLSSLYCGLRPDIPYKELIQKAEGVELENFRLREFFRTGHSSRRGQPTVQEGVCGTVTYAGDVTEFLPYLTLGQWLHIGKQATFGMGRYDLQIVA